MIKHFVMSNSFSGPNLIVVWSTYTISWFTVI